MILFECDKCGKVFENPNEVRWAIQPYGKGGLKLAAILDRNGNSGCFHFCPECTGEFLNEWAHMNWGVAMERNGVSLDSFV